MGTRAPQIARVADGTSGINTLSAVRTIPIVFVPGTMGSRLTDPDTDQLIWNPMGRPLGDSPRAVSAKTDRIADVSRPLVPDATHRSASSPTSKCSQREKDADAAGVVNFTHVIPDFYGDTILAMHSGLKPRLKSVNMEPKIYCCGYDWRVDNGASAQLLAGVVNQAMSDCAGEKVILVAHSMGGLVCRYYCRNLGGETNVRAQFLLASPTLGAVDAYVTLKTGATAGPILALLGFISEGAGALGAAAFWSAMGGSTSGTFPVTVRPKSREFVRKIPSVWQLLPSVGFVKSSPAWATFDASNTGWSTVAGNPDVPIGPMTFADLNNLPLFYLDQYTGFSDLPNLRDQGQQMVAQALDFHASLLDAKAAAYVHPSTFALFCADNPETPIAAEVDFDSRTVDPTTGDAVVYSSLKVTLGPGGDKTVPTLSANMANTTAPFRSPPVNVPGTEHQKLPSQQASIQYLVDHIAGLLGAS